MLKFKKPNSLVCGWGIDDTNYAKFSYINNKTGWLCPIYRDWYDLIKRVYSDKYLLKHKNYKDCSISEDWKYFSNFRRWVLEEQPNKDWETCHLDKDLLVIGNKIYSPDTCAYIPPIVNLFIVGRSNLNLIGAYFNTKKQCFIAQCRNPFTGNRGYLGLFQTKLEAHKAWQAKKHEYACLLAEQQQDPRVAKALKERYAPDKDWSRGEKYV